MRREIVNVPVDPTLIPEAAHKLAQRALREHQRAEKNAMRAVEHVVKSGQALLKAYDLCEHGQWIGFFEMHFQQETPPDDASRPLTLRTAQKYMQLARDWSQLLAKHPDGFSSQRQAFIPTGWHKWRTTGERRCSCSPSRPTRATAGRRPPPAPQSRTPLPPGTRWSKRATYAKKAAGYAGCENILTGWCSLHRRLANYHIGGEWFHLTPGVRALIQAVIADEPD